MDKASGIGLTLWETDPYKLISWWDMEDFSASEFYNLCNLLEQIVSSQEMCFKFDKNSRDIMLADVVRDVEDSPVISRLSAMDEICNKIGLRDSSDAINEVIGLIRELIGKISISTINARIEEIQRVVEREMKRHLFLHVPVERAEYYQSWGEAKRKERGKEIPLFGNAVKDKFPSVGYDVTGLRGHPLEGTLSRDNSSPLQEPLGFFAVAYTYDTTTVLCHPYLSLRPLFHMSCFDRPWADSAPVTHRDQGSWDEPLSS